MKKFQFFLLVEALLLSMALLTILSESLTAFILILALTLLALLFFNKDNRGSFLLTVSSLFLFLVFMLNPYIIAAVLLAVAYTIINHFSEVKHRNRYAVIEFEKDHLAVTPKPNQWIGVSRHISQDFYTFDDINVIRISGSDTIDLTKVIVTGRDNVVIIRKIYGPTKIIVPRDIAVKLDASAIYASVSYLGFPEYDLRNQSIKLEQKDDQELLRSVKVVVNIFAGSVEVVRA
ncbi:cell wall-active antibiotics response protein LiaF [Streptococcus tangpeifui]|uniref:cell wall-active antibiotics response protein LiaF n=1 Tax=Streptococcus tangpeifui TaxID=2709400 RepID=UPI0013EB2CF2|nr:cell wall-active antibiotics response protein LiaF [Streptococcus sp. ZJ373]